MSLANFALRDGVDFLKAKIIFFSFARMKILMVELPIGFIYLNRMTKKYVCLLVSQEATDTLISPTCVCGWTIVENNAL